MEKRLQTPYAKEKMAELCTGNEVLITGEIYTARDAAHKRLIEMISKGEKLPFPIEGALIYYAGPTPEKEGRPIGAVGPTTSYRMDAYAPALLDLGQAGMIGKGQRSEEVISAIVRNGAVYFAAIGGAGALIANSVVKSEVVAFEDLGAEAIRRLLVVDFPATVVIDSRGRDLYQIGREDYLRSKKPGGESANRVYHEFDPIWDENSKVLVLGTIPSVMSRKQQFYYGHPQNRFWKVIASVTGEEVPNTVEEKKALLLRNGIALWDVLKSCEIDGSSDVSIRGEEANDMAFLLEKAPIQRVYANGAKAFELYMRHCYKKTGREIEKLPSTSPANAAFSLERLCDLWKGIL